MLSPGYGCLVTERSQPHRDLLVLLHPVEDHLDDLPAQPHALVAAVLSVGQVVERRAARHLDALVVLVALQGGDHELR